MPPRRRTFDETAHRRRFGDQVRAARTAHGWSQEDLADRSGLHRTYVVRVERGMVNISIDAIQALADGLGLPVADLFAGMGTPTKAKASPRI